MEENFGRNQKETHGRTHMSNYEREMNSLIATKTDLMSHPWCDEKWTAHIPNIGDFSMQ